MNTTHRNARLQSRKTSPFHQIKALINAQSSHSWLKLFQIENQKSSIINRQLTLFLSLLFLSSCADKPTAPPAPKPKQEQAQLVGRIASIHKNPDFTLIQSYGKWTIQTDTILATIGPDGRAANLKVTGEKTGQFAAADIQSGTLEIGDSVFTTLKYEEPEQTPTPETPDTKEAQPETGTHHSRPPHPSNEM